MFIFSSITQFWRYHPALLYGTSLLLGCYTSFYLSFYLLIPLFALWLPFCLDAYDQKKKLLPLLLSLALFFAAWAYASLHHHLPTLPDEGVTGTAHLSIQDLTTRQTPFGSQWVYQCYLHHFFSDLSDKPLASRLKCQIIIPQKTTIQRPLANQDYVVRGRLMENNGFYRLKVSSLDPWSSVANSWSLAEKRFAWKNALSKWIQERFKNPLSGPFLAGLVTGELSNPDIRHVFARFGLQHILAISGFHFAILSSFLSLLLRLLFPRKVGYGLLWIVMSGYFFFLGFSASVARAYLMSSFMLAGYMLDKNSTALNSLGLALIGVLLIDPLICQTLSFQLSFSVTAAILLSFEPFDYAFNRLLPKRPLSEVVEMAGSDQHGYYLLILLRQGLALSAAVNLVALPFALYLSHQFPFMSLLYNLFFPLLAAGSLSLLLLGSLFSFIPYVGTSLHAFNDAYTSLILKLTYQMPGYADYYLTVDSFGAGWLISYLSLMMLLCILAKSYLDQTEDNLQAWVFI